MSAGDLTVGEVCAGYGGLGMGLAMLAPTRLAWVADNEPGNEEIGRASCRERV